MVSPGALVRVRVPQRLLAPVVAPGALFRLRFVDDNGEIPGPTDFTNFVVQASTSFSPTNQGWVTLTNNVILFNGELLFDDTAIGNFSRRFYRVIER